MRKFYIVASKWGLVAFMSALRPADKRHFRILSRSLAELSGREIKGRQPTEISESF
jgi:hypothetical protein